MRKTAIGVIGASQCTPELAQAARHVGRLAARRGAIVVCGGLGGVMEAACQGAREEGGLTVGIIPGYNKHEANPYLDVVIATGMGHGRNTIIAATADVLIAIGGGYGTLSEIALALKIGRPVIVTGGSWDIPGTIKATTPQEAVEKALEATG